MLRTILFASLAVALGACATQETQTAAATPAGNRDCFQVREITDQEVIDDRNIKLTARNIDYIMTVSGNARQLDMSEPLIINTHNSPICTGNGIGVTLHIGDDPAIPVMVRQIARAAEQPRG